MKLFDVDWVSVLHDLQRWDALPLPARRILLDELKPSGYVYAERLEPYFDVIAASGIAVRDAQKRRLCVSDAQRPLVKVLRAMGRHPLFHLASTQDDERELHESLIRYLEEHFTSEEVGRLAALARGTGAGYVNKHTLAPFVAFAGWVGDLLDASNEAAIIDWAENHGLDRRSISPDDVDELLDLQVLVQELLTHPGGMPLRDLLAARTDVVERETFAAALHLGLGTLVIFAGMRAEDLEPMIGLWPSVVSELTRAPTHPPAPMEVGEEFSLAVYMEDMTTLLAAIAASPVRVRANDSAVFARTRAEIEKRLVALPEWVARLLPAERVDHAARELLMRHFVVLRNVEGSPHLHATAEGSRWLTQSTHDRLAALVEPLRTSKEKNPGNGYDQNGSVGFFPYTLPYYHAPKGLHLRADLARTLLQAADSFLPIAEFLAYAARNDNPLLTLAESSTAEAIRPVFYGGQYTDARSTSRDMWRQMLAQFLTARLIGLGGAVVGVHQGSAICFKLTAVGRYLLGAADSFEYGSDAVADIVIQPNFDVVFLGAAPGIEAELARFSERVGVAPGRVFRITRASVLAAAESGAAAGDVIGALARASSKPVPKNVQHEIAGWMGAVRRATFRRVAVLECADADVAARIVALLGAAVRQIAPTVFEVSGATSAGRLAMMRKLRAGGVFVDEPVSPAVVKSRRARDYDDE